MSKSKNNIVEALSEVLADSYLLTLKIQNFHWNVTGPNFKSLHELFGDLYEELSEAVDEIAERIRALDSFSPGSFKEFSAITNIKEATKSDVSAVEMLKQLIKDHEIILATLKTALAVAQADSDEATADILIRRIEAHEKNKWMLKSSLS